MNHILIWTKIVIGYLLYRVEYLEPGRHYGWFLVKRVWVWVLLAPVILSLTIAIRAGQSIIEYFAELTKHDMHWVEDEKRGLSFKERVYLTHRLLN